MKKEDIRFILKINDKEYSYPSDFKDIYVLSGGGKLTDNLSDKKFTIINNKKYEIFRFEKKDVNLLLLIPHEDSIIHFYSSLVHELKNPIAAIKALVQVVELYLSEIDFSNKNKILDNIHLIGQEIDRMNRLFESFSLVSKPTTKFDVFFDLVNELEKIVKIYKHEFQKKGVRLELISFVKKLQFYGNPDEIYQIMNNILKNSFEAIEHENGKISIILKKDNEKVFIIVKDNGKGMTEDELLKIERSFYTSKPHGSGFGLQIVKNILRNRGGNINIKSLPGKGTEVTIVLPIQ